MATAPMPSRGEFWLVNFEPAIGSEIRKIRPALVISLDGVGKLPLRMVVPITDWKLQYTRFPWFTLITPDAGNGLIKDSGADAFQTKSLALVRFVRRMGFATSIQLDDVAAAVALCVGAP